MVKLQTYYMNFENRYTDFRQEKSH